MPKFIHKSMPYEEQDKLLDELCQVLRLLKSDEDIKYFLKDLLGRGERVMLVRRFKIAKMLGDGKTYQEIAKEMGTSSATIARVERLLNFGRGGYRKAILRAGNE